ncbi:small ribosomal subunit protein cS23-like [Cornus florida]|uniref:small ribosomal subunit protein cS23-like n=1 Tax=Cornus florida TaxID=4283 RepID=UPI00289A0FC7|nr:small ribosomal subunit protein cS23-like [Cornus florida]
MLSLAIQPSVNGSLKPSTFAFPTQKIVSKPLKESIFVKPNASSFQSSTLSQLKINRSSRKSVLSASSAATAEAVPEGALAEDSTSSTPPEKEKLGVVVKTMGKPRLVLKFIWMEKNIGIALNQVIPGHGTIPLSPYYFWPRKDAWEELKVMLESKPWISQKQMIIFLNQATDIINLWQQSGGDLA